MTKSILKNICEERIFSDLFEKYVIFPPLGGRDHRSLSEDRKRTPECRRTGTGATKRKSAQGTKGACEGSIQWWAIDEV